jgi:hypothetical protein
MATLAEGRRANAGWQTDPVASGGGYECRLKLGSG